MAALIVASGGAVAEVGAACGWSYACMLATAQAMAATDAVLVEEGESEAQKLQAEIEEADAAAKLALETSASPCSSFDANTGVLMANGTTRRIADIHEGDQVIATNPSTGQTSARTVTATMSHDDDDLRDLTIVDGENHHGTLQTTDHHKIWSVTAGAWVLASELREGDQLRESDGAAATLVESTKRPGHEQMLDLTVDTDHTFYVDYGGEAILVHNEFPCDIPTRDSTGKIHWPTGPDGHSVVPTDLPSNWTPDDLEVLAADLTGSIARREDDLARLGPLGDHGVQPQKEKNLLAKVLDRLAQEPAP